ncbi:MAG: M20/M25/M40 family metallo-hydrolase [Caulobacteraceae bacterium]|nr:M20/M25/M40 family metallo-hydrolase [Caulobacteraceae bacterium]
MVRRLALFGCIAAAFVIFYASARTPDPAPAGAPPTAFSAGRAMADVAAMAPAPHPIGSPANRRVRDYLVGRMRALGLSPQVRAGTGVSVWTNRPEPVLAAGAVENLVGVLPGRDRSLPALALMAHYDSVPGSPGAADDATGVASALEIVRAIRAGGVPARDVMVVITDGEEAGLLGARAFFRDDPLAAHVGFVINMESRGGGGRAAMFETGAGDGPAVGLYRRTAASPDSTSLSVFVYKHMPNDTDFSVARAKGLPGFNYAFIGRQFDYHSPSSTVAALDQGSVQHLGEEVLPTARALAVSARLPARGPDAAYGDLFGLVVVAYPPWAGWLVLAAAAGLLALAALAAGRVGALGAGGVAVGFGAGLVLLVGGAIVLVLARLATGVAGGWIGYRPLLARFALFEAGMALGGLAVLLLVAWASARLKARLAGAWVGLLIGGLAAALAVQIAAPTIGPAIAWPLLAASAAAALTQAGTSRSRPAWILAAVIMTLALAWLGGLFHNLLQGLDLPAAPALIVWLAALALWPLAWPDEPDHAASLAPGLGALALGFLAMAWLHFTSPWSPRHPNAVEPLYVVDADTGRAWRVSATPPDAWMRAVLTADSGAPAARRLPTFPEPLAAAPARPVQAPAPAIVLQRAADGLVSLSVTPAPGADRLRLDLRSATPLAAVSFEGQPAAILGRPGQWSHLTWSGQARTFVVRFRPSAPGGLDIAYAEQFPAWPATARPLPPLPANDMAWDRAGDTMAAGTERLSW